VSIEVWASVNPLNPLVLIVESNFESAISRLGPRMIVHLMGDAKQLRVENQSRIRGNHAASTALNVTERRGQDDETRY
jgi:hypothetical protein